MAARQGGVRPISKSSIEIDFYYRGARCRERLKLAPTPRNLKYAENLLGQIKVQIEHGIFDYAATFPRSRRGRKVTDKPASFVLVEEQLDTWYKRQALELQHSTLIGYRRIIDNVLAPAIGKERLPEVTRAMLKERIVDAFPPDTSAKRINNVLSPLRVMLAEAVDDGLIPTNPAASLTVRRKAKPKEDDDIDPFTVDEVAAILAAADEQFENYCRFNFACGARTSEVIGLWWPRVDWTRNKARITQAFVMGKMKTTKTKAGLRDIELLPPALDALKAQRKHSQLAGEAVFLNPDTGKAWEGDRQVREHWRKVLKQAGVRYRYPYQMRHTFASQALSAGENLLWVSKMLGHTDPTMTARVYARWMPTVAPEAGHKLVALWDRDGQDLVSNSPEGRAIA